MTGGPPRGGSGSFTSPRTVRGEDRAGTRPRRDCERFERWKLRGCYRGRAAEKPSVSFLTFM